MNNKNRCNGARIGIIVLAVVIILFTAGLSRKQKNKLEKNNEKQYENTQNDLDYSESKEYDDSIFDEFLSSGKLKFSIDQYVSEYVYCDLGNMYYAYIDFNNDGVHELVLYNTNKNRTCVYGCQDENVIPILGSGKLLGWYQFNENREVYILCTYDERNNYIDYYYFDGKKAEQILERRNDCYGDGKVEFYQAYRKHKDDVSYEYKKVTYNEFQAILNELTEGGKYCSYDINNMHYLKDDYKDIEINMEQLSEDEKKRIEAIRVVDANIEEYHGWHSIRYTYADLDGDGVEELCTARSDSHGDPIQIYKVVDGKWKYMGEFGQSGELWYVEGENFLSESFGNQGCFIEVTLRLTDDGFEKVCSSVSFDKYNVETEESEMLYYKDLNLGDVKNGFTNDMGLSIFQDEPCTSEEYYEYNDSIYRGNRKHDTCVSFNKMQVLYQ